MEIDPRDDLEEVGSHDRILDDGDDDFEIDPNQEDIGTDDPHAEDGVDDPSVFEDTEIDGLPEVGEADPEEEPELELLDDEPPPYVAPRGEDGRLVGEDD